MSDESKPTALLCDIDGTLAVRQLFGRGPYDWDRVGEDRPVQPVVDLVAALRPAVQRVVFVSGRDDVCLEQTWHWLHDHAGMGHDDELHMRLHKDNRPDHEIKLEIYRDRIEPRYDVRWVIDDRNQVVAMWRSIGLTVLQVADGDF